MELIERFFKPFKKAVPAASDKLTSLKKKKAEPEDSALHSSYSFGRNSTF